jgi:hypothetical protein
MKCSEEVLGLGKTDKGDTSMADERDTKGKKEEAGAVATVPAADGARRMNIRLSPVSNSDQAVVSNYTSLNVAPGMVFIDFGFLEPGVLAALPRMARQGGKLPETIGGKLAVRVAIGYDSLANLHQQLGQVLTSMSAAARDRQSGKKQD